MIEKGITVSLRMKEKGPRKGLFARMLASHPQFLEKNTVYIVPLTGKVLIKTKFLRTLLGSLKVTQDNPRETWSNIPLQDFSIKSDIIWSKPISEIDKQLFEKYQLTEDEIDFIEKNVKPMI